MVFCPLCIRDVLLLADNNEMSILFAFGYSIINDCSAVILKTILFPNYKRKNRCPLTVCVYLGVNYKNKLGWEMTFINKICLFFNFTFKFLSGSPFLTSS